MFFYYIFMISSFKFVFYVSYSSKLFGLIINVPFTFWILKDYISSVAWEKSNFSLFDLEDVIEWWSSPNAKSSSIISFILYFGFLIFVSVDSLTFFSHLFLFGLLVYIVEFLSIRFTTFFSIYFLSTFRLLTHSKLS